MPFCALSEAKGMCIKMSENKKIQVPDEVEIKVVEESAKVVYLVLPVNPEMMTGPHWCTGLCRDA